ncbi:MAG: hypothetical protein V4792_15890 [Pseudomonadota bacterium]
MKSWFIKPSHPMSVWTARFTARLLALQPGMSAFSAAEHAVVTFPDAADLEPEAAAEIFAAEEPPGEAVNSK